VKVIHFYAMKPDSDRVRSVAPQHAAYWKDLRLLGYQGGPFADRSGGLITFEADSIKDAERLIAADPFVRQDLLATSVVKQWVPE
jgi:uncharacterized protein YciI